MGGAFEPVSSVHPIAILMVRCTLRFIVAETLDSGGTECIGAVIELAAIDIVRNSTASMILGDS